MGSLPDLNKQRGIRHRGINKLSSCVWLDTSRMVWTKTGVALTSGGWWGLRRSWGRLSSHSESWSASYNSPDTGQNSTASHSSPHRHPKQHPQLAYPWVITSDRVIRWDTVLTVPAGLIKYLISQGLRKYDRTPKQQVLKEENESDTILPSPDHSWELEYVLGSLGSPSFRKRWSRFSACTHPREGWGGDVAPPSRGEPPSSCPEETLH